MFVDNEDLGDHRAGGYQPFWINVPASSSTRRELLVVVDNRFNSTTAPTTTGGDFYFYGGITRNVILHELPWPITINRVQVLPVSTSPPVVNLSVFLRGSSFPTSTTLSLSWNGAPAAELVAPVVDGVVTLDGISVPGAAVWSLERPALTTLLVLLRDGGDSVFMRFGLRVVAVEKATGRLTVNGEAVKLKGINRHTMWPDTGSAVTLDQIAQDVALLKVQCVTLSSSLFCDLYPIHIG